MDSERGEVDDSGRKTGSNLDVSRPRTYKKKRLQNGQAFLMEQYICMPNGNESMMRQI